MKEMICLQDAMVARAARSGHWDTALKSHADACPTCKEVVQTVLAMQSLAAPAAINSPLPDADLLWRKALLAQKQAEADRALWPLRLAEFGSAAVIAMAFAAFLVWYWPQVLEQMQAQFTAWQTGFWRLLWQAGWSLAGTTPELSSAAAPFLLVLAALVAALVVHPLLAEE